MPPPAPPPSHGPPGGGGGAAPPPATPTISSSSSASHHHHADGYWGPPTSTVDWCEANYEHTPYVAELFNSLSSLVIVLAGLVDLALVRRARLEPRFYAESLCVVLVGLGSTLFHGTLLFRLQMLDELPMVYTMLVWFYVLIEMPHRRRRYPWLPLALFLYGVLWSLVHVTLGLVTVFQVHFVIMLLTCVAAMIVAVRKHRDPSLNGLAAWYLVFLLVAFACWLVDFHLCREAQGALGFNAQFHAWWHVFVALSCYFSVPMTAYARGLELGASPTLGRFRPLLLPISLPYVEAYRRPGETTKGRDAAKQPPAPAVDFCDYLSEYPALTVVTSELLKPQIAQ